MEEASDPISHQQHGQTPRFPPTRRAIRRKTGVAGIVVGSGLLSGLYPAFVHSAFQPTRVLKTVTSGDAGNRFACAVPVRDFRGAHRRHRNCLQPGRLCSEQGLGFETEQTLYFRTGYPGVKDLSGPIEDAVRQVPGVVATSRFTKIPFSPYWSHRNVHLGHDDQGIQISSVGVDEGFVDLFAMKLLAGRNIQMGVRGEVIINETAVSSSAMPIPARSSVCPSM